MARLMYRYALPADGRTCAFLLTGNPVHVSASRSDIVEFWAEHDDNAPEKRHAFRVFGTGHELPAGARWVGTTDRTPEGLVWHLYDVTEET